MATTTGTRSGNPAKKAAAKKAAAKKTATRKAPPTGPSSVGDFKKRREGTPLLLPSGLVMTCRRVELQTYLKSSQGDVYNPLLGIVGEALEKGQMIDTNKLVADEDGDGVDLSKLNEMYDIVNGMVIAMAVNPPVHPEPESEDDRDDNLLYVDEVEDEDKMFLFQWGMGGTDDIATFRREAEASMDALAKEPSNKPAAKRAPGSRKR